MIEFIRKVICKVTGEDPQGTAGWSYSRAGSIYKELATIIFWLLLLAAVFRTGYGMYHANKPDKCIVRSVNDIIVSPFYALGCNLAKDRWEYKIN